MDLKEIGWEGVDWINRAQVRDKWRAFVNTGMNMRFLKRGIYRLVEKRFASQ